ncbi:dihydrofolate reductase [Paenibacillus harenae]|uniref:Dihydrofolate reductase n=1 Tax=Paenibacillus harenae TaxID=306543 RepID=A0ABT9TYS2_PAEHA|nr:dihydrofolate reductase [Paenibacillus harenae]MDQ0057997.1 dihydrofolate reductase [Paenibacillus harenae]MDQ0111344.1 dihydrofolate reductase [Paenibacillus harenae]
MSITLIAAMDRNRAIGIENRMPWRLKAEMAYFTANTTGKTVLMGRKTFDSIGKPLKNRKNVILTRQIGYEQEGCEIVHSIEQALERYRNDELMIMGGADIYEQFLPFADKLLLTDVEAEIEGADAYFPAVDETEWDLIRGEHKLRDEHNTYNFTFCTYLRKM